LYIVNNPNNTFYKDNIACVTLAHFVFEHSATLLKPSDDSEMAQTIKYVLYTTTKHDNTQIFSANP